jgi:hypothetical protein
MKNDDGAGPSGGSKTGEPDERPVEIGLTLEPLETQDCRP